jgi:hypothetical protein
MNLIYKVIKMEHISATQIQKVWKGYIHRKPNIPNSLQSISVFLNNTEIKCSSNISI